VEGILESVVEKVDDSVSPAWLWAVNVMSAGAKSETWSTA
jgi:hypothetical protein